MDPCDNFLYTCAIFLIFVRKCKKMKIDHGLCLINEEVLEDIIKTVWTEQCGNLEELRYQYLGKAALVCPG